MENGIFDIDDEEINRIYVTHHSEGCFMDQSEWESLVKQAYLLLINRAMTTPYNRITMTYSELGAKIGLVPISEWFHLKIAWILYACATLAYNKMLPMITALVVNRETGQPGKGFWGFDDIPQELYRASSRDDITPFKLDEKRDTFWVEELKRIDKWGKDLKQEAEE